MATAATAAWTASFAIASNILPHVLGSPSTLHAGQCPCLLPSHFAASADGSMIRRIDGWMWQDGRPRP